MSDEAPTKSGGGAPTYYAKAYCSNEHSDSLSHGCVKLTPSLVDLLLNAREELFALRRRLLTLRSIALSGVADFGDLDTDHEMYEEECFEVSEGAEAPELDEFRTEGDRVAVDEYDAEFSGYGKYCGSKVSFSIYWGGLLEAAAPPATSETARALARGIVADEAADRLPVLADALEEAGEARPWVLAWCRDPDPKRAAALVKSPFFFALAGDGVAQ